MAKKDQERKRQEREDKRGAVLRKAWDGADVTTQPISLDTLEQMASSSDAYQRLMALVLARKQIDAGHAPEEYFELGRRLISDPDSNCRWQAVILTGDSITSNPDRVWQVVSEFGDSADEDMRSAIACALLEELLDRDFERYFPLVRNEVANGRLRFLDTLSMCWFDECKGANYERAHRYLGKARRGSPGARQARDRARRNWRYR